MSLKLVISDIELEDDDNCTEVAERMNNHLKFYSIRHPEFSYKIIEDKENNKLTVKTATLTDGNAN